MAGLVSSAYCDITCVSSIFETGRSAHLQFKPPHKSGQPQAVDIVQKWASELPRNKLTALLVRRRCWR
jgi:hypothetical protein